MHTVVEVCRERPYGRQGYRWQDNVKVGLGRVSDGLIWLSVRTSGRQ